MDARHKLLHAIVIPSSCVQVLPSSPLDCCKAEDRDRLDIFVTKVFAHTRVHEEWGQCLSMPLGKTTLNVTARHRTDACISNCPSIGHVPDNAKDCGQFLGKEESMLTEAKPLSHHHILR